MLKAVLPPAVLKALAVLILASAIALAISQQCQQSLKEVKVLTLEEPGGSTFGFLDSGTIHVHWGVKRSN